MDPSTPPFRPGASTPLGASASTSFGTGSAPSPAASPSTSLEAGAGHRLVDFVQGCTFDDFLLRPQYSVLERRDPAQIDLSCRFSEHITLKRPLVSANMDTVTRAPMAIVQAEEGGLGIIDRGFRAGDIEPQVREVEKVKRTQHLIIRDPYFVRPETPLAEAVALMRRTRMGTLVVVDDQRRLKGLLTERDVRFVPVDQGTVATRMTPAEALVKGEGELTLEAAERVMTERKVKKLPLVDRQGKLLGLITAKDIGRQERLPFATRDAHGRLLVGAAIGAKGDYLERAAELIRAGVDVIVIDIAHGHSIVMARAIEAFRARFGDFELVAGNVGTADGVRFLVERGVNAVKVGIGPGGGCTTRITTSFGVPQVQALVECRLGADRRIPLIADGGVRRHGAILEALLFGGDTVMLGSMFAGTEETPGEIVQKPVVLSEAQRPVKVPFKVLRGMASIQAIRDRLDVEDADTVDIEALGAEGTEVSVPARGSVRPIVQDILRHLCSSISYGGATRLAELKTLFWNDPFRYLVKLSASGRRESYDR
jgi:IMP dehydrogenase